jgi:peptide/nickel transport system permease protein
MVSARYFLERTAQAIFTFAGAIVGTFVLIRFMPGGPIDFLRAQLAQQAGQQLSQEEIANRIELYTNIRPDRPMHEQFLSWVTGLVQGDMGQSMWYNEPVADIIGSALPWTIFVSICSLLVIYVAGILLGTVTAYIEGSKRDIGISVVSIVTTATPFYLIAVVLLWFLGYQWELFPTTGRYDGSITPALSTPFVTSVLWHGTLPIASLVLAGIGRTLLNMRANSIQVLGEDYLRVARLRGLPTGRIATRYVGRTAFLPMYTQLMISIGTLFGSSVILEEIYSYPGIGYYLFRAVSARDYPLMMGAFIFMIFGVIIGVYIADLTYGFIDPRASTDGGAQ